MKILIEVGMPNGIQFVEFKVIEQYQDGSVLALPIDCKELSKRYNGKPTLFHKSQIKNYIE